MRRIPQHLICHGCGEDSFGEKHITDKTIRQSDDKNYFISFACFKKMEG